MVRRTIKIERNEFATFAKNTLGTDAFNAISSIPGTQDVQIDEDGEQIVTISYAWTVEGDFNDTATVLARYQCKRVGW